MTTGERFVTWYQVVTDRQTGAVVRFRRADKAHAFASMRPGTIVESMNYAPSACANWPDVLPLHGATYP